MQTNRAGGRPTRKATRKKSVGSGILEGVKPPREVKAPKGDVASSGGDYGMKRAKRAERSAAVKRAQRAVYDDASPAQKQRIVKNAKGAVAKNLLPIHEARVARNRELAKSAAGKDTKGNEDRLRAAVYAMSRTMPSKPKGGGGFSGLATIGLDALKPIAPGAVAIVTGAEKAAPGNAFNERLGKMAKNAPGDAADLVVNTPASVVKLASTAYTDPAKVPGMLAEPYKQLLKDPIGFTEKSPISSALMVAPTVKVPGRVAGKVARSRIVPAAKRQSLSRPAAKLPATALKEQRPASRDAAVNALQKRKDAKRPEPKMSERAVRRRVDEFYDFGKQKKAQAAASAYKEGNRRYRDLPKAERRAKVAEHVKGAEGGTKKVVDRRFAREFGAAWYYDKGVLVKPKNATEGAVHKTRAEAEAIRDRLNAKPAVVDRGMAGVRASKQPKVPVEFVVKDVGNKFAVVPQMAADQLRFHNEVGSTKSTVSKVMRVTRKGLTKTVLPTSAKWLAGQIVEPVVRGVVQGAGPWDYARMRKVYKQMDADSAPGAPKAGAELRMRIGGGQFGKTGAVRDQVLSTKTLADEFEKTGLSRGANALTKAGAFPPVRAARTGYRGYSKVVLDSINGSIENVARTTMAGKALKKGPLLDDKIVGLGKQAIADAAKGLKGTDAQVRLAREVDRAYGQYQKMSPEMRSLQAHWSPFLPWYINSAKFLTRVLPNDHPVKASLVASSVQAQQEWLQANKMSFRQKDHKPSFLMGGYPSGPGETVPLGKYTPFGITDPNDAFAGLVLPHLTGPYMNIRGKDWKGADLKYPGYNGKQFSGQEERTRAAMTFLESQIPGLRQAGQFSGLTPRLVDHKESDKIDKPGRIAEKMLPWTPIKGGEPPKRKARKKKSGSLDILSGGGSGMDILR